MSRSFTFSSSTVTDKISLTVVDSSCCDRTLVGKRSDSTELLLLTSVRLVLLEEALRGGTTSGGSACESCVSAGGTGTG